VITEPKIRRKPTKLKRVLAALALFMTPTLSKAMMLELKKLFIMQ